MPPLIKDFVEFRRINYLAEVSFDNHAESVRSFLPTDGLIELLCRVLESIARKLGGQSHGSLDDTSILLTGGNGVGKSHLLSLVYSLIHQKAPQSKQFNDPRIDSRVQALRQLAPLTVCLDLSQQVDTPLPEIVLTSIHQEFLRCFSNPIFDVNLIAGIDTIKAHELMTFNVATECPILLMVDGLSARAQKRTPQQLNEDIEFLSFIAYSSKSAQLFLLVAAHEDFFSPKTPLGIDGTLMAQTLENFRIEWIDRNNLKEIVCRYILRKNSRQQQDLRKLYSFIKAKLPNFQYSEYEFSETYPFHPLIFDLADKLKGKLSGFSLLDFIMTTYPKVASRRAVSLVTIDTLFDRTEYEIRTNPAFLRLTSAYQELADQGLLRLEDRWRLWGKMLLKACFLFTLADRAPSVRDLADSLLLFEDSETGLSYNVIGMILGQMEKALPQGFTTTDDRLDRTYRLGGADVREELNRYLSQIAGQIPDSNPRIAETLLCAAQKYFPDWPFSVDGFQSASWPQCPMRIHWKGTERPGLILPSHRFHRREYDRLIEVDEVSLSNRLPFLQDPEAIDEFAEDRLKGEPPPGEIEWLLWMEPVGITPIEEETILPKRATEVHWVPSVPSEEEFQQLKRILALQLTEKSSSSDFSPGDLASLREELDSEMANLFRELYLHRGRIITCKQRQALNQGHLECRTLRSLLGYVLKPNLDQLYSAHPQFGPEAPSESQVMLITRRLFANQDPTRSEVQRLAGQFALPLGLVSRSEGLYELNLSITPPLFLTQVIQYLETLDATEQPVQELYDIVHRPPFGLTWPPLWLILSALTADGQIELFDPDSNTTISRENLPALESVKKFSYFKHIQTHKDYPVEVLTHWCRLITGRQDLSDISTSRGRTSATSALGEWLDGWRELQIPQKLDSLPNALLTTQMWHRMAWTKRRFEKLAEIVDSILQNEIPMIQGMGRILELFGENVALLEKASRNLVELSHFLHWLSQCLEARTYLLSSEKTESDEIESKKESLLRSMDGIHELIAADKASEFENMFQSFKEQYVEYYATQHDQCVGPKGDFSLLDELESSREFHNLQLLVSLPLGDPGYISQLDEWVVAFRDFRCLLPVRDILNTKPSCNCAFKLARPLNLIEVVQDLKAYIELGLVHHRESLRYYRHIIEPRLINENGEVVPQIEAIQTLLADGPMPDVTQEVLDQITSYIEGHYLEESLEPPLPMIAPSGRITKRELVSRVQSWLDSLASGDDVLFTLKEL